MDTRRLVAVTLFGLLLVCSGPTPAAHAYGAASALTYDGQLSGYTATWKDWWDPDYSEECVWWEYDPYFDYYYCVVYYWWEHSVKSRGGLYDPGSALVVVDEATGWSSAQAPVSPVPITAYGTWVLHGLHLQVADFWVLEGQTWSYQGQNEWLFHQSWVSAAVPPPVPHVSSITPTAGASGTLIAIAGDTFGASQGTVTVNGLAAAIHSWTPTNITAVVPTGATTGPVQVVSTLQQGSNTNHTFTVLPPAPPPEEVQYYHLDHLGSVRMITDSAAQVVARYDYTPYGQPFPGDLDAESRRFAQMERTPETGNQSAWEPLAYAGARYYHSQTGRFISADDPIYGDPFDPQSMNLYAYARNNPLGFIDPLGHSACPPGFESDICETVTPDGLDAGTIRFVLQSLFPQAPLIGPGPLQPVPSPPSGNPTLTAIGAPVVAAVPIAARILARVAAKRAAARATARVASQKLLPFTARNFRTNLARLTGEVPNGAQAHHVFPQQFAPQFQRLGINIHDPRFGAWWQGGAHQQVAAAYNQA